MARNFFNNKMVHIINVFIAYIFHIKNRRSLPVFISGMTMH